MAAPFALAHRRERRGEPRPAAFPAIGPKDLVTPGVSGVLGSDLRDAALAALQLDRSRVHQSALEFTWQAAAKLFLTNIETALSQARQRGEQVSRNIGVARPRAV